MDIKKILFWGAIFGIIVGMLTFDVDVFDPNHPEYLGVKDGYASMGLHFAVVLPICISASFFMKYIDLKSVGGRANWERRRKFGHMTSAVNEVAATALMLFMFSLLFVGIALGLEFIPREAAWRYIFIIMAVYAAAYVVQLLLIRRRNARRFRKTS